MANKILVIDDEEDMLFIITEILSLEGYDVRQASTGQIALNEITQNPPDLILLDVMMDYPDDGREICKKIKKDTKLQSIPVLLLTADTTSITTSMMKSTLADGYILKPFRHHELIKTIEKFIRKSKKNTVPNPS